MKVFKRSISWFLILMVLACMAPFAGAQEDASSALRSVAVQLRERLVARQSSITVQFQMQEELTQQHLIDLMEQAVAHTGNPAEGDYLENHIENYEANAQILPSQGGYDVSVTYTVDYYTTAEQEQKVAEQIEKLLAEWNLGSATKQEKVTKIYSHITSTVDYDFTNLENEAYNLKYSAYAALINGTAVCQGYANLFYRMALSLGIDCRIIHGSSRGESHAWNIAKLDGKYYLLDATWDEGRSEWNYFLKGSSDFADHLFEAEYVTEAFKKAYPISAENYTPGTEPVNPFKDVAEGAYYAKAVLWAVSKGITNGMGEGIFCPNDTCTRGQIVTFLWRANGSPEPQSTANPFSDVATDAYYAKAVLWAVEKGITNGTGEGKFSPNAECIREQIVTFLWRSQGKPTTGSANPFGDVASGTYYYDAVLWAVDRGITNGISATTFAPKDDCTRGQIVTFLYRCLV